MAWPALIGLAGISAWLAQIIAFIAVLVVKYFIVKLILRSLAVVFLLGFLVGFYAEIIDIIQNFLPPAVPEPILIAMTWLPDTAGLAFTAVALAWISAIHFRLFVWLWDRWTRGLI